jgi:hypothetical protein
VNDEAGLFWRFFVVFFAIHFLTPKYAARVLRALMPKPRFLARMSAPMPTAGVRERDSTFNENGTHGRKIAN